MHVYEWGYLLCFWGLSQVTPIVEMVTLVNSISVGAIGSYHVIERMRSLLGQSARVCMQPDFVEQPAREVGGRFALEKLFHSQ